MAAGSRVERRNDTAGPRVAAILMAGRGRTA
jgi:hypothetical protein